MGMEATWYFDVVSPYAYLALGEVEELGRTIPITYKPVLFAGLLKHYGHLGPAEIPSKRIHTYRLCIFEAERRGIGLRFPPVHPFNPLRALRVLCALGAEPGAVRRVMDYVWREGHDPNEDGAWEELCQDLGIDRVNRQGDAAAAKAALRRNTDEAIAQGVFGVPTLVIGRELFWGVDALPLARAYLSDSDLFRTGRMASVDTIANPSARSAQQVTAAPTV
jgi:2-hydroxychromene-2-carboxylate isomerase